MQLGVRLTLKNRILPAVILILFSLVGPSPTFSQDDGEGAVAAGQYETDSLMQLCYRS
jgi:hypothetical protein